MAADQPRTAKDTYAIFAEVYDAWQRLFGKEYAVLVAPLVNERLASQVGSVRNLIDLACGTGTFAVLQARAGTHVTGVDLSEPMLRQALRKASGQPISVQFVQSDMSKFNVARPVDAITCLYASLGHLNSLHDVCATFERVRAHLRPGGAFVFDLNTPAGFEALWRNPSIERGDGFTIRRTFEADCGSVWTTMHMTIEIQSEVPRPGVSTLIRARWFSETEIRAMLTDAGLAVVDVLAFNPFTEVAGEDLKQLWTAVRPL